MGSKESGIGSLAGRVGAGSAQAEGTADRGTGAASKSGCGAGGGGASACGGGARLRRLERGAGRIGAGAVTPGISRSGWLGSASVREEDDPERDLAASADCCGFEAGSVAGGSSAGGDKGGAWSWFWARAPAGSSPRAALAASVRIRDESPPGTDLLFIAPSSHFAQAAPGKRPRTAFLDRLRQREIMAFFRGDVRFGGRGAEVVRLPCRNLRFRFDVPGAISESPRESRSFPSRNRR